MRKKCSYCNLDGHNSRTCQNQGVRIFGKRLTPSDHGPSATAERKKAVQWTEDEHKMFLLGLKKLGKGDWCGIARNYVFTRTPTQVASHAQKYFLRHSTSSGRNRRSSVFDVGPDEEVQQAGSSSTSTVPQVSEEQHDMQNNSSADMEPVISDPPANNLKYCYPTLFPSNLCSHPTVYPGFLQGAGFHYPVPYWSGYPPAEAPVLQTEQKVIKPVAVRLKSPINVEKLDELPRLSL